MSLQYGGGTIINRTSSLATRQNWCDFVAQACVDAGWTLVTGPIGSATVVVETASGNSAQKVRAVISEPGSGNCAQAFLRHASGSPTSQAFFAFPQSLTWRVVATKYHFFAFISGAGARSSPRGFVCGGLLWTPPFIPYSSGDALAFMHGNAISDADATSHYSWRTGLYSYDNASSSGRFSGLTVATLQDMSNWSTSAGAPSIANWQGFWCQGSGADSGCGYRWKDGTLPAYEPLMIWGDQGVSAESKIQGQLYDAMVMNDSWSSESAITYDGHSWIALTDNAASINQKARATLFLAVA